MSRRTSFGAAGTVTFVPSVTPIGQPARNLQLDLFICQTNSSGTCINPSSPGGSSTVTAAQGETSFFSIFAVGKGTPVPFDPANSRIFLQAFSNFIPVGQASVAVRTQ